MPTISKQKNLGNHNPKLGSVLSQAIAVEDLEDDYIKITIFGQNRTGKTTLACQFPKPLLLIAFEPAKTGGAKSVKKVPGVEYIKITSSAQALKLADELTGDHTYKTHVLDTATSFQDIILKELLNLEELPEQLNWGTVSRDKYRERSEKTRECLRPFLELSAHTVILCKERDHNPPDREQPKILRGFQLESYLASDLGGATVGWLHDACDNLGRLYLEKEIKLVKKEFTIKGKTKETTQEVETGRIVRRLRTLYHPNIASGLRSSTPKNVPEYIDDPTYEKIAAVIEGRRIETAKYPD